MRMHKNRIWLAFLVALTVVTAGYCVKALYNLYQYAVLTEQTPAQNVHWGITPLSDDQFLVKANYEFSVGGRVYPGETDFKDVVYMNPWAAEQAMPQYSYKLWQVWYQNDKFQHSTLQKKFPAKECYSAGAMVILLLYFVWLGFYVTRYQA